MKTNLINIVVSIFFSMAFVSCDGRSPQGNIEDIALTNDEANQSSYDIKSDYNSDDGLAKFSIVNQEIEIEGDFINISGKDFNKKSGGQHALTRFLNSRSDAEIQAAHGCILEAARSNEVLDLSSSRVDLYNHISLMEEESVRFDMDLVFNNRFSDYYYSKLGLMAFWPDGRCEYLSTDPEKQSLSLLIESRHVNYKIKIDKNNLKEALLQGADILLVGRGTQRYFEQESEQDFIKKQIVDDAKGVIIFEDGPDSINVYRDEEQLTKRELVRLPITFGSYNTPVYVLKKSQKSFFKNYVLEQKMKMVSLKNYIILKKHSSPEPLGNVAFILKGEGWLLREYGSIGLLSPLELSSLNIEVAVGQNGYTTDVEKFNLKIEKNDGGYLVSGEFGDERLVHIKMSFDTYHKIILNFDIYKRRGR